MKKIFTILFLLTLTSFSFSNTKAEIKNSSLKSTQSFIISNYKNNFQELNRKLNTLKKINETQENKIRKLEKQIENLKPVKEKDILNSVSDFYEKAWIKLLWFIGILGSLIPLLQYLYNKKSTNKIKKLVNKKLKKFNTEIKSDFKFEISQFDFFLHETIARFYSESKKPYHAYQYLEQCLKILLENNIDEENHFSKREILDKILSYIRSTKILLDNSEISELILLLGKISFASKTKDLIIEKLNYVSSIINLNTLIPFKVSQLEKLLNDSDFQNEDKESIIFYVNYSFESDDSEIKKIINSSSSSKENILKCFDSLKALNLSCPR